MHASPCTSILLCSINKQVFKKFIVHVLIKNCNVTTGTWKRIFLDKVQTWLYTVQYHLTTRETFNCHKQVLLHISIQQQAIYPSKIMFDHIWYFIEKFSPRFKGEIVTNFYTVFLFLSFYHWFFVSILISVLHVPDSISSEWNGNFQNSLQG